MWRFRDGVGLDPPAETSRCSVRATAAPLGCANARFSQALAEHPEGLVGMRRG
jgi:hypothetical protein